MSKQISPHAVTQRTTERTEDSVEGYHEGCSCCSLREPADANDIRQLIKRIDDQKYQLSMLLELVEEYGSDMVVIWFNVFETVRRLNASNTRKIK